MVGKQQTTLHVYVYVVMSGGPEPPAPPPGSYITGRGP